MLILYIYTHTCFSTEYSCISIQICTAVLKNLKRAECTNCAHMLFIRPLGNALQQEEPE